MLNNRLDPRLFNNSLNFRSDSNYQARASSQRAGIVRKKHILVWSDSCVATTGFGIVAKHILRALYDTGLYDIDQLAINHFDLFYDKEEAPYRLIPARMNSANDPYGGQNFVDAVNHGDYGIVFIINDTAVVEKAAQALEQIRTNKRNANKKVFSLVYYYPVDCCVLPCYSTMIKIADRSVAYTEFAKREAEKIGITNVSDIIYHGADTNFFFPLPTEERRQLRKSLLNVEDDGRFVIVNVNRNSLRKNMAQTIYAFSEFRKKVPNSTLYLHTRMQDRTNGSSVTDLNVCLQTLGLDPTKDVISPLKYNPAKGFATRIINQLVNCADVSLTTALGEGFGICTIESMAAGVPVIAGDHTSTPEILGNGRGYIYPCKEMAFIDNSGMRPAGRTEDVLEQMMIAYNNWKNKTPTHNKIIRDAMSFAKKYSWENVCKQWVKLFAELPDVLTGGSVEVNGEKL